MLGLIVDVNVSEISLYVGKKSCLDLNVLNKSLLQHHIAELNAIGITDVIIYSQEENSFFPCKTIYDIKRLKEEISENGPEQIIIVYSNTYFEINCKKIFEKTEKINEYIICDSKNNEVAFVVNDYYFLQKIIDNNCEIIKNRLTDRVTYFKKLSSVFDYKNLLTDILYGKTETILPEIAEGVYSCGKIPKGDFILIPPVYFGENVQIEAQSIVGPGTVIMDNSLVSSKACVKNTILSKDCYISSGCFCDNSFLCKNVSVRRNSAVFCNSVLGHDASVGESSFVESNSYIKPFVNISDYKNDYVNFKKDSVDSPSGFYGYTPEKAALLGGAIGSVFEKSKIGVLCNGEINASILKLSLISGLMSVGTEVYDFGFSFQSSILYFINFCELDYGIFIDGSFDGTMITIIDKFGNSLFSDHYYELKQRMINKDILRCSRNECKNINNIHSICRVYIRDLFKLADKKIKYNLLFKCSNNQINIVLEEINRKLIYNKTGKTLIFNFSDSGTYCELICDGKHYNKSKLCDFVSHYGENTLGIKDYIYRFDAVYLCFAFLGIVGELKKEITVLFNNIPSFYIAQKVIMNNNTLSTIASRLSEYGEIRFKNGEISVDDNKLKLKFLNTPTGNKIKLLAHSVNAETSQEILDGFERFINILNT